MPSVLVTGSNRGLGLEWVRQYAGLGWRVFATCRRPEAADELNTLAAEHPDVSVHRLDVTAPDQIAATEKMLEGEPLDLLINNAGVYFERWNRDPVGSIDYGDWEETLRVNTLGAVRVTEALLDPLARAGGLAVAISSHMGSIADIDSGRNYAYRSSKAALNAAVHALAHELAERGVGALLLHPGWVRTRMGGGNAPYTPGESVSGMRRIVEEYSPERAGRFFKFDGSELPW